MFRTVPLSIIRSFSLYTQRWHMSYRFANSLRAGSWSCSQAVWHIPFLCVQWKTPDDGQWNCPKNVEFYSKNKYEKLVHLVGFIIRISDSTYKSDLVMDQTFVPSLHPEDWFWCSTHYFIQWIQGAFLTKQGNWTVNLITRLFFGGEVKAWSCFHTSSFPWSVIKHSNKSLVSNYKSFRPFGRFKKDHKLFVGLLTWIK